MVNVVYADGKPQELSTTLLGTPVRIRATPVNYHWDFGDGNTIDTKNPGGPWPDETVASKYRHEGWYRVTLTTKFSGEFSVNGGPWQPIDGTITKASAPISIFARSYESHLVDPYKASPEEDFVLPPNTPENAGAPDENAEHRKI